MLTNIFIIINKIIADTIVTTISYRLETKFSVEFASSNKIWNWLKFEFKKLSNSTLKICLSRIKFLTETNNKAKSKTLSTKHKKDLVLFLSPANTPPTNPVDIKNKKA